jgi:hypothetical protein
MRPSASDAGTMTGRRSNVAPATAQRNTSPLEENHPALRIARVLGCVEEGHTVEVELWPGAGDLND